MIANTTHAANMLGWDAVYKYEKRRVNRLDRYFRVL
jgi:hypothetical protein